MCFSYHWLYFQNYKNSEFKYIILIPQRYRKKYPLSPKNRYYTKIIYIYI